MPMNDLETLEAELRARRRGRGGLLPGEIPMPPAAPRERVGPPAIDIGPPPPAPMPPVPEEVSNPNFDDLPGVDVRPRPLPPPPMPGGGSRGSEGFNLVDGFWVDKAQPLPERRIAPPSRPGPMGAGGPAGPPAAAVSTAPKSDALGIPDVPPVGPPAIDEQPEHVFKKPPRDFEAERRRQESLGDIAEGLGNIQFITGAQVRAGLVGQPPFHAEGARRRLDRLDREEADRLTPEEVEMYRKAGLAVGPDSRRSTVEKFAPQLARADAAKATRDRRLDKEKADRLTKVVDKYRGDPSYKNAESLASGAQTVKDLIASGDQQALKNAVVPLARLLGEKGPLSDADRAEIKYRMGITARIEDWVSQNVAGTLTPEFVESLKKMADVVTAQVPKVKARVAKDMARQYSRATGLSEADILDMLNPEAAQEAPGGIAGGAPPGPSAGEVEMIRPDGQHRWIPQSNLARAEAAGYRRA